MDGPSGCSWKVSPKVVHWYAALGHSARTYSHQVLLVCKSKGSVLTHSSCPEQASCFLSLGHLGIEPPLSHHRSVCQKALWLMNRPESFDWRHTHASTHMSQPEHITWPQWTPEAGRECELPSPADWDVMNHTVIAAESSGTSEGSWWLTQ